jgi:Flp pilus assembly protein TadD
LALKNQFTRAIEDLNRAIELNPKLPTAYNMRGMVYAQIGNPRATADFQKACDMGFEQGCSNWQRLLKNR